MNRLNDAYCNLSSVIILHCEVKGLLGCMDAHWLPASSVWQCGYAQWGRGPLLKHENSQQQWLQQEACTLITTC